MKLVQMKLVFLSVVVAASSWNAGAQMPTGSSSGEASSASVVSASRPIRVAVAGLVHDHALGMFGALARNHNVTLVGISESDKNLISLYSQRFSLASTLFYPNEARMIEATHPDAVLVYTSIADHRKAIEIAARHHVNAMVEKPLATTMEDALAIRKIAREDHIQVLVNYETTWYASNAYVLKAADDGQLGTVHKVIVRDGHEGPKEIGVSPTFLNWLTDPAKNGAGAMFDFGCYGADLMTVMMHGEAPLSVTAVAQTDKPEVYPHVDDDATIVLHYKTAQAVLLPSWNWTTGVKNMEVYGTKEQATTVKAEGVELLGADGKASSLTAPALAADRADSLGYLVGVLRGEVKPEGDLTALSTNMVVMQILDAARRSAKEGRTVMVTPVPK